MRTAYRVIEMMNQNFDVAIEYEGGYIEESPVTHLAPENCCEGSSSPIEVKSLTVLDSDASEHDISELIVLLHDELVDLIVEEE